MATIPIPAVSSDERPLTREEGLNLLDSMYGIFEGKFEDVGGAEAFYQAEREAWIESPEHP